MPVSPEQQLVTQAQLEAAAHSAVSGSSRALCQKGQSSQGLGVPVLLWGLAASRAAVLSGRAGKIRLNHSFAASHGVQGQIFPGPSLSVLEQG